MSYREPDIRAHVTDNNADDRLSDYEKHAGDR